VNTRAESRAQVLQWLSSFLFMGILLGLMFIMATALILYYKQVAEGLADAKRYAILQQVGLSRAEIKKTVSSQLLTLFYVPLVVAAVHTLVAAPFVQRIMVLFGITHWRTYMLNIAVTLGVFALLYVLMYRITSGVYYRIVAERRQ
jgi:putative ABC transport system permease protein